MVDNAAVLENDQGRSGLCSCTCSPTVTSFMELNEYESLLSSLSIQGEVPVAPQAFNMSRNSYVKDVDGNVNVRLAYAYDTPPSRVDKGDRPFFLTLVTEKVDILHHAQASLEGKLLALKRDIQVSDGLRSYFTKIIRDLNVTQIGRAHV